MSCQGVEKGPPRPRAVRWAFSLERVMIVIIDGCRGMSVEFFIMRDGKTYILRPYRRKTDKSRHLTTIYIA